MAGHAGAHDTFPTPVSGDTLDSCGGCNPSCERSGIGVDPSIWTLLAYCVVVESKALTPTTIGNEDEWVLLEYL